ncbi:MAG TPA: hypothetical protein DCQ29_02120 [Chitinophagaceae bacterium]|nr:hypothetical protein [Chitinophagaceae bacterium]
MSKIINELFTQLNSIKHILAGELKIEKDSILDVTKFESIDFTPSAYTDKANFAKDRKQISKDLRKSINERKKELSICQS